MGRALEREGKQLERMQFATKKVRLRFVFFASVPRLNCLARGVKLAMRRLAEWEHLIVPTSLRTSGA